MPAPANRHSVPSRDRTVHGITNQGDEVVRYDRSGKWWVEYHDDPRDTQIALAEAVALSTAPGAHAFLGLPGGKLFDARVRKVKSL